MHRLARHVVMTFRHRLVAKASRITVSTSIIAFTNKKFRDHRQLPMAHSKLKLRKMRGWQAVSGTMVMSIMLCAWSRGVGGIFVAIP